MKIIPLSEGAYTIDKTKVFVPFNETTHQLRDRPVGSLLVEVQPFLVITDHDVLLLDTGLGFTTPRGEMQLRQLIMDAGVNPSEVTKVLMSHLHKDHAGGICVKEGAATGMEKSSGLTFPDAKYYVQKQEFELALSQTSPSYIKEDIACLEGSEQLVLIEGNGMIDEYIAYEMTAAHSQFHQVFWIDDGHEKIFFGGDDAPQLSQMKKKYIAKYDYDGKKCMELRQQWWAKGQEENWTFLFYHDIKTPMYKAKIA